MTFNIETVDTNKHHKTVVTERDTKEQLILTCDHTGKPYIDQHGRSWTVTKQHTLELITDNQEPLNDTCE